MRHCRSSGKTPFDGKGSMGQMYKLFGDQMDNVIDELNEALAA
jgi:type I restriction enzyme R subunit